MTSSGGRVAHFRQHGVQDNHKFRRVGLCSETCPRSAPCLSLRGRVSRVGHRRARRRNASPRERAHAPRRRRALIARRGDPGVGRRGLGRRDRRASRGRARDRAHAVQGRRRAWCGRARARDRGRGRRDQRVHVVRSHRVSRGARPRSDRRRDRCIRWRAVVAGVSTPASSRARRTSSSTRSARAATIRRARSRRAYSRPRSSRIRIAAP